MKKNKKLTTRQHILMDFLVNNCVGKNNAMQAPDILLALKHEYFPTSMSDQEILSPGHITHRRGLVNDISVLRKTKTRMRLICSDKAIGYYLPSTPVEAQENLDKRADSLLKSLKQVNSEIKELKKNGFTRFTFGPYEKEVYQTVSSDLVNN